MPDPPCPACEMRLRAAGQVAPGQGVSVQACARTTASLALFGMGCTGAGCEHSGLCPPAATCAGGRRRGEGHPGADAASLNMHGGAAPTPRGCVCGQVRP